MKYFSTLAGAAVLLAVTVPASVSGQSAPTPKPAATDAASAQAATPQAMFNRWDTDKNKSLSVDEFQTGWKEVQMSVVLRKLHATFESMDKDKSGGLEAGEYANLELVRRAGKDAPMLAFFDTDKNGKLDFREYSQMIARMMKK